MPRLLGDVIDLVDKIGKKPFVIQEGESFNITGTFKDEDGVTVPEASIVTLLLTLFDESSGTEINSRKDQDIFDANGGTVNADGTWTMRLDPLDQIIVAAGLPEMDAEMHIARFVWTWNDGVAVRTGIQETRFGVQKLKVTVTP